MPCVESGAIEFLVASGANLPSRLNQGQFGPKLNQGLLLLQS